MEKIRWHMWLQHLQIMRNGETLKLIILNIVNWDYKIDDDETHQKTFNTTQLS